MADEGDAPYLPDRAPKPTAAAPQPLFAPKPVTMAELLAETAPPAKVHRRKITLSPRAVIRRRGRLSPVR